MLLLIISANLNVSVSKIHCLSMSDHQCPGLAAHNLLQSEPSPVTDIRVLYPQPAVITRYYTVYLTLLSQWVHSRSHSTGDDNNDGCWIRLTSVSVWCHYTTRVWHWLTALTTWQYLIYIIIILSSASPPLIFHFLKLILILLPNQR